MVRWTSYKGSGYVSSYYLKDKRLDVVVGYSLNVSILDFLVPNMERSAADGVED